MSLINTIFSNKEFSSILFFIVIYFIQYINLCILKKKPEFSKINYNFTIKYQLRLPIIMSLVEYSILCNFVINKEPYNNNSDIEETNIYTEQPSF